MDTRRYALDKRIFRLFGDRLLADVNNLAMRDFVDHSSHLAPSTIRDYSNIVKAVVASEGIRTPGLLVANEEKSKLRLGATIT